MPTPDVSRAVPNPAAVAAREYRSLVSGRACGPCRVCCKLPDIPELNKPVNTWCAHIDLERPEGGCGIYDARPPTCRDFECAWLSGLGAEADRPDLLGVMWQPVQMPDGGQGLAAVEYRPGALEQASVRAQLDRFARLKPGRILLRRAAEARFRAVELTVGGRPAAPAVELYEPKPRGREGQMADGQMAGSGSDGTTTVG